MQLADPRFANFQYRANLFEIELFLVIATALTPVARVPAAIQSRPLPAVAGRLQQLM